MFIYFSIVSFIAVVKRNRRQRSVSSVVRLTVLSQPSSPIIIIAWAKQYIKFIFLLCECNTGKFEAGRVSKNCSCLVTKISRNSRPQGAFNTHSTPVLERTKGRPQSFLELPHVCLSPMKYTIPHVPPTRKSAGYIQ